MLPSGAHATGMPPLVPAYCRVRLIIGASCVRSVGAYAFRAASGRVFSLSVTDYPDAHPIPDALVPIGYLSKPHGIRGELVFLLTADDAGLVSGVVYLRPRRGGNALPYTIERTRMHHGNLLISFHGVDSRTEAELLRAHSVLVNEDRLPPLDENEVWLRDLPGLRVLADNGNGVFSEIGLIVSVDSPAGQLLWTIETPDDKEILFPAVDEFVLAIDPDKGEARIAPPPGLLELYLGEH